MDEPRDAAALEPPAPRFCKHCGAELRLGPTPETSECPSCPPASSEPSGSTRTAIRTEAAEESPRPLRTAIGLYFALLATSIAGFIAGRSGASDFAIEVGISILDAVLAVVWTWALWSDVRPAIVRPVAIRWIAAGLGFSLATYGVATAVVEGLHWRFGVPIVSMSSDVLEAGYGWLTVVLLSCVQPALTEELAFRGVIFTALRPLLTPTEAVLVSALLFMTLHLAPASFPHTFAMGLAAGFLRLRTESLLPGIALHFSHNFLCVAQEAWQAG